MRGREGFVAEGRGRGGSDGQGSGAGLVGTRSKLQGCGMAKLDPGTRGTVVMA